MAPRKNPRDSVCPHCRKSFTKGGLRQHLKYVKCRPTATASPRKFERVRCRHCGKSFHSTNSLRVHVSTVHAKEYAKSPGHMKHHRAPYHGKKHNGVAGPGRRGSPGRSSPHASPQPAEHASSHERADGQRRFSQGVVYRMSGGERRHRPHPPAKGARHFDDARNSSQPASEPAWHRALSKNIAEAAGRK